MKNLACLVTILLTSSLTIFAQSPTCDCKTDLDFVVKKLKDTPSFKEQMKGEALNLFNETYNRLSQKSEQALPVADCYSLLQEQIGMIDDFHLNLLFNGSANSSYLKAQPYSKAEVNALKTYLETTKANAVEGIYKLGESSIEIGLKQTANNVVEGIVLTEGDSIWRQGEVYLRGKKNKFGKYNLISNKRATKTLQMINNISFDNARLVSLKKLENPYNAEFKTDKTSNWEFKALKDNVQYIYFGSFNRREPNKTASKEFLSDLKTKLTADYLIVDLRSNGGGANKISQPFFKLLKKSKAKIYVLTNSFTVSNAEQFTVKLKSLDNTVHLGQGTYGAITYGSNYGNVYETPSGYFSLYPTDMNFHKQYFQYEGSGVVPDIKLDFNRDWIEQTLEIIEADQK
ncbi:S41 family peptidase [Winogradskyella aurantia]|uniref:Tail specific protease domain-containing protein n=1 Tax=Winogradskyella aurantia TaxID=1915063 RepID=A0A265UT65_9FLAO|nr:S41 family peptidase [Winogradskyella aurantia]OZV68505.1 hypothetical protein CA834_08500 [Winogradskyella aurantia]